MRVVSGTGGGPDKTIAASCACLNKQGHHAESLYILDPDNDSGAIAGLMQRYHVHWYSLYERGPVSLSCLRKAAGIIRNGHYDIVHCHDYKTNVLGTMLKPRQHGCLVATAHGYNPTSVREHLYYACDRVTMPLMQAVITPSRSLAHLLNHRGVPADRLWHIPNGIDCSGDTVQQYRPFGRPVRLLYLGRLSREKDPFALLDAVAILADQGVRVHLTIAGDGPAMPDIRQHIRTRKLQDMVHITGYVDDVPSQFASCDIFVNPSRTECMPNTILEAMRACVPIVATDVGGVGEMIRHDREALLCPPQNPQRLADNVLRLVRDPDLAANIARRACERVVHEYSFERRMERMVALYHRLLQHHPRPSHHTMSTHCAVTGFVHSPGGSLSQRGICRHD